MNMPKIPKAVLYPILGFAGLSMILVTNYEIRHNCAEAFEKYFGSPVKRLCNRIDGNRETAELIKNLNENGIHDIKHIATDGNDAAFSGYIGDSTSGDNALEVIIFESRETEKIAYMLSCKNFHDAVFYVNNNTKSPASEKITYDDKDSAKVVLFDFSIKDTNYPRIAADKNTLNILEQMRKYMESIRNENSPHFSKEMKKEKTDLRNWERDFENHGK
ncbi:MAG: hypothetical protein V1870_00005 [Candidatus Aenigmatarchaeota archaeon]